MHQNGTGQAKAQKLSFVELPGTIPDVLEPHNAEAEEAVLGALLIDPDALILLATFLRPEHFYLERHAMVYRAICDLSDAGTPADALTVSDELTRRGQLDEIGGPAYLTDLIRQTPTSTHAEYYGRIVERDAVRRQVIDSAGKMARLAFEHEGEAGELLADSEKLLAGVANGRANDNNAAPIGVVVAEVADDIDRLKAAGGKAVLGLPTGLLDLDKLMGGLQRSDLIVIGGRPGMGKSALAAQIAVNAARKHNAKALIFSLEMSKKQLVRRMISAESGIEENRIKSAAIKPDEWTAYLRASDTIAGLPVTINDTAYWTTGQLRAEIIRFATRQGVDLVVLDYLQLMAGDGKSWQNKHIEISEISRTCKVLARELNIPFVALSQLSRRCEERGDKRPMLSDLRESGAIEADADVVIFIYRDEVYNPDSQFKGMAEAIIAKHRGGPTGTVELFFKANLTKFCDLETKVQSLDSVDF